MPIKSIRPITPSATSMPSKAVAPLGTTPVKAPIGAAPGQRDTYWKSGLQPIGDQKTEQKRDNIRSLRQEKTLPYAFMSAATFMPSGAINKSTAKFNEDYSNRFSTFSEFMSGFGSDFGAGAKKTYQTSTGAQDLYEFQYQNFLKYGDIRGPQFKSEFVFRDGLWWSTRKPRQDYAEVVESLTDPVLKKYALNKDESALIYSSALKQGLSEAQYQQLYKYTAARKFFDQGLNEADYWAKILNNPEPLNTGYNRSVSESAIFGDTNYLSNFKKQFEGFVSNASFFADLIGSSVEEQVGIGASQPGAEYIATKKGGPLEAGGDYDFGGWSLMIRPALKLFNSIFGTPLYGTGDQKKGNYWTNVSNNIRDMVRGMGNLFEFAFTWQYKLGTAITNYLKHKKKKYWLTNSSGKIIDTYADMTDAKDKADLAGVAASLGITNDQAASALGAYYRYRVLQNLNPILEAYKSAIAPGGRFAKVEIPNF